MKGKKRVDLKGKNGWAPSGGFSFYLSAKEDVSQRRKGTVYFGPGLPTIFIQDKEKH